MNAIDVRGAEETSDTRPETSRTNSSLLIAAIRRFAERNITERSALPIAVVVTLVAGVGDLLTTAETSFTLFYLVPLAIATWFRGKRAGYLVIGETMLVSGVVDIWLSRRSIGVQFVLWNLAVELGLYLVFATMLDALRTRVLLEAEARQGAIEQLRHAERLNTLGKLAAGIAHELGAPMDEISDRAGLIARGEVGADEARKSGAIIVERVQRMAAIMGSLRDFARRGGANKRTGDLTELCRETVELVRPLATSQGTQIVVKGEPLQVRFNPSELQQVLSNLITNALHAVSVGGHIEVSTRLEAVSGSGARQGAVRPHAVIVVRDDGPGIAPDVLPLIFDPFFTTKEVGQGTGLGLSVSYGIVHDHGGFIRVETRLGGGTSFMVHLPQ